MTTLHRTNRVLVGLVGLLALAAGAYGLIRSFNGFGRSRAAQPLITGDVVDWLHRSRHWFWPVVGVAGLVVFLVGLRWLLAQLRFHPHWLDWSVAQDSGPTTISGKGVAEAVRTDLLTLPAVEDADARVAGHEDDPRLELRLQVNEGADTAELLDAIGLTVTPRFCQALERDSVRADVLIELTPSRRFVA